jgi:hypothetical protein
MTSYIVDLVLLIALLATSARMGAIYRELKRLRGYHGEYKRAFDQTAAALAEARSAVLALNRDGSTIVDALGTRIDQAQALIGRFETLVLLAFPQSTQEAAAAAPNPARLDAPTMIPISAFRSESGYSGPNVMIAQTSYSAHANGHGAATSL